MESQLLLLATLQIISNTELQAFTHVRGLPARILAQLLHRYILLLGQTTKQHAELCGRAQPNLEDAVNALQKLGFNQQGMLEWATENKETAPEDGPQLKDIAQLLYDRSKSTWAPPQTRAVYREMTDEEFELAQKPPVHTVSDDDDEDAGPALQFDYGSSSGEDEALFGSPVSKKKSPKTSALLALYGLGDAEPPAANSDWKCINDIPPHIPPHFPPLPGLERDDWDAVQLEEDALTKAPEPGQALHLRSRPDFLSQSTHMDPWKHVVAFERSHLAEKDQNIDPASFPVVPESRPAIADSSLLAFYEAHRDLSMQPPHQPFIMQTDKRKVAATSLNHLGNDNGLASLFGVINPLPPRSAKMSSGWLPYPLRLDPQEPDPVLHPFDLDKTMLNSMSVPLMQARPFTRSSAIPRSINLAADLIPHLAATSSRNYFSRLTRIAPPGPLGANGKTLPYLLAPVEDYDPTNLSKVQEGRLVQYGFEWKLAEPLAGELPKPKESASKLDSVTDQGEGTSKGVETNGQAPTSMEVDQQELPIHGDAEASASVAEGAANLLAAAAIDTAAVEGGLPPAEAFDGLLSVAALSGSVAPQPPLGGPGSTGPAGEDLAQLHTDALQQPQDAPPQETPLRDSTSMEVDVAPPPMEPVASTSSADPPVNGEPTQNVQTEQPSWTDASDQNGAPLLPPYSGPDASGPISAASPSPTPAGSTSAPLDVASALQADPALAPVEAPRPKIKLSLKPQPKLPTPSPPPPPQTEETLIQSDSAPAEFSPPPMSDFGDPFQSLEDFGDSMLPLASVEPSPSPPPAPPVPVEPPVELPPVDKPRFSFKLKLGGPKAPRTDDMQIDQSNGNGI